MNGELSGAFFERLRVEASRESQEALKALAIDPRPLIHERLADPLTAKWIPAELARLVLMTSGRLRADLTNAILWQVSLLSNCANLVDAGLRGSFISESEGEAFMKRLSFESDPLSISQEIDSLLKSRGQVGRIGSFC